CGCVVDAATPALEALIVAVPAWSMWQPANVAIPLTVVTGFASQSMLPLPLASDRVTAVGVSVTGLPNASSSCTAGCSANASPAVAPAAGPVTNTRRLAPAADTITCGCEVDVAMPAPDA